jgi:aspartyl protease family protein
MASGRMLQKFKYLGIWFAIILVMVLGYSFRSELSGIKDRVMAELVPSLGHPHTADSISFPVSSDGHFYIRAKVNGVPILFLADTGASHIVLTPSDARKAGIDPENLTYDRLYSTANGTVRGGSIRIDNLTVGSFSYDNIRASVNEVPMRESLLGMTFFKRLDRYEVKDDILTLYARP